MSIWKMHLEQLSTALGHADRKSPLGEYMTGLLLPLERKSVEPMAAVLEPRLTGTAHQRMHHFVAKSGWSDQLKLYSPLFVAMLLGMIAKGAIDWLDASDKAVLKLHLRNALFCCLGFTYRISWFFECRPVFNLNANIPCVVASGVPEWLLLADSS